MPLFDPDAKFEPGAGWPSFHAPVEEDAVSSETDRSDAIRRTEVLCRRWDARLGHLLPDGPEPTGRRYCINPATRELEPKDGGR